ncbi:unnamed protein product [Acanthoscelides obtectus]|uniref:MADF domain-containing protein n=1 Tax=Acanthoscelides obtectus TaxID=200917 RepID=A0A9P0L360_ACAOB|nr:unnamed protein product [Acanthoscelides obtectus]CAK1650197.1 hypothetical protein AOBTE_LOCUS16676 [Acanthoscelides obtectus]
MLVRVRCTLSDILIEDIQSKLLMVFKLQAKSRNEDVNGDDCKRRWRNIKDTYFRNRKKRKFRTGSAASERVIKWTLYDRLSFLDVIKHERESKNTLTEEEETPAYSETDYEIQPTDESTLDDSDLLDEYSTPSTSRRTSDAMKLNKGLNKNPFQQNCGKRSQPRVSKLNTMAQFEERAQKRMELLESIHKKKHFKFRR